MNWGVLFLWMLILGIEPIVISALLSDYSLAAILPIVGLINISLLILYAIFSYPKKDAGTEEKKVQSNSSYLIFPAFVFCTLTIDAFFVAVPNIYGYIAMLVGALVFFTATMVDYHKIKKDGIFLGKRRIMPKDYVFWIVLIAVSVLWFMLGSMQASFKLMLSSWALLLLMAVVIHGMNLIKRNSLWKLASVKFTLILALVATCVSALHTYILITDNRASFAALPSILYTEIKESLNSGANSSDLSNGSWTVMQSWSMITGEILSWSSLSWDSMAGTGDTVLSGSNDINVPAITGDMMTWATVATVETQEDSPTATLPSGPLTFRTVLQYLVDTYELTTLKSAQTKFENIPSTDSDYNIFNIAAQHRLIGKDIRPDSQVSCKTYLVLKWLSAGWKVTFSDSPFEPYWNEGIRLNEIKDCTREALVTKNNL